MHRRRFMRELGAGALSLSGALLGWGGAACGAAAEDDWRHYDPREDDLFPATRNERYALDRPLTEERIAATYNNFYEFTMDKDAVVRNVVHLQTKPWQIEITGHVRNKMKVDAEELLTTIPQEERLYRHRCVEAWGMAVPWSGFPMQALIDRVEPTARARFVRFVSFYRPDQAIGQRTLDWYKWPYYEGLTMDEARNELTFLVTGIYGHELTKQHGAPIRLVTPWKYGYKSIKSIVTIEFTDTQPPTFWNDANPREYDFTSNVNPRVPHPRWSQTSERMIGTGKRRPTLPYNGYGEYVAHLYET